MLFINVLDLEVTMKKFVFAILVSILLSACAPEIGSDEWCVNLKEKPKGDWTITETKDYTKHCLFK